MGIKFNELKKPNPSDLLIVDTLNLAFRYKHSKARDFGADYLRTVQSLASSYSTGKIVFAADWGSSQYRKQLLPSYKQNRADKYETQTEQEKQEVKEFFDDYEKTIEMLKNSNYTVLRYKGVEADDIAGHIVKNRVKYGINNIWLTSSDKDWDLLINECVSRFSYVTRKETTLDNWDSHYDCFPEQYLSLKCLMGDSGDNVKGVEGIGPKRAKDLLNKYDSVFDIIDAIPLSGTQKFITKLNESKDILELNVQLMDLLTYCDEAIGEENIADIKDKMYRLMK